jgi:hypothetical protein
MVSLPQHPPIIIMKKKGRKKKEREEDGGCSSNNSLKKTIKIIGVADIKNKGKDQAEPLQIQKINENSIRNLCDEVKNKYESPDITSQTPARL